MNKHSLYLFFCFLLFGSSCQKDKPGTAADEQGDYFTCYVNGQYWEAYSNQTGPQSGSPIYVLYNQSTKNLSLNITRFLTNGTYQKIYIPVYNVHSSGNHNITVNHDAIVGFSNFSSACNKYYHDTLNPGSFNLTYWDQQEHRMKGTFSMTLRNPDCPDSLLYITNGKFSFHYY